MLIAVKSVPHEQIFLQQKVNKIKVKSKDESTVKCCLYKIPKVSPLMWPEEVMVSLIEGITTYAKNEKCISVILTEAKNFECTNWNKLKKS